jgi:hypothetical protein
MKQPEKTSVTELDNKTSYPWVEAALCAEDLNAFLMGLSETEFAVLLAELEARRLPVVVTHAPGRQRRNGGLKRNQGPRPIWPAG